jgi:G:T-mismatch repair DNA endonuclease (very short patch repair protein)
MLKKDKIIQDKYNGVHPTCQCGCGQQTRYEPNKKDYCKWISGHQSRVAGHFGDPKSEKRVNAIISTRKAKFASGEYDHILDKVSQNRSEETKQKISEGGTGVSRPKADGFGIGRIHSQATKDKMSKTAIKNILKDGKNRRSKLEYFFEGILVSLNIDYTHSYYVESINKIYDFHLPKYNILIEVDGDFWHCNPQEYDVPLCKTQHINIENDKFKSQWALDNGYTLLRFWEDDINNNIKQVKQTLLEHCK